MIGVMLVIGLLFLSEISFGDTVTLKNGTEVQGHVLKSGDSKVTVRVERSILAWPRSFVSKIDIAPPGKSDGATARLAAWAQAIDKFGDQSWVDEVNEIPATVVDVGPLKNVPYSSYRSGQIEFNVYGDPSAPACVEIGIYGSLLKDEKAKKNCVELMSSLLGIPEDREVLKSLLLTKDLKTREGLTFEVTPETDEDAYGGWWVSIYSEKDIESSRASKKELEAISVSRAQITQKASSSSIAANSGKQASTVVESAPSEHWNSQDLQSARPLKQGVPPSTGRVYVRGYTRKDGTYVSAHTRRR
jgi:hypothetical protein